MTKNPPVELTVKSASAVNQYNKQQLQAQTPDGVEFTLNLTDKSPKLPAGIINASHTFEIWEYAPPGKPTQWYGTLAEQPTSFSQPTSQLPTQAAQNAAGQSKSSAPTSDSEIIKTRSMALAYAKDLVCAEQLIIGELKSKADSFTSYIMTGRWFADKATEPDENVPDF